jgi:D-alanine-D-alanine ligase
VNQPAAPPVMGTGELEALRRSAREGDARISSLRISVVCGGDTAEREVSLTSGRGVHAALQACGCNAQLIDLDWSTLSREIFAETDVAFLTLHGGRGENGVIQGFLESISVPYVGAGVLASAVCMHKPTFKRLAQSLGFLTPPYVVLRPGEQLNPSSLAPHGSSRLVVKPASEGSSVGISIVQADEAAEAASALAAKYGEVLVEACVSGTEVTASVLGHPGRPIVLPHVEIRPVSQAFYDYKAKYTKGETNYIIPAEISAQVSEQLARSASTLFNKLHLAPYARIDSIIDSEGDIHFLEANTLPGFTELSLVPQAAAAAGIDYVELLRILLYLATYRND